jgi:hypothetical protein
MSRLAPIIAWLAALLTLGGATHELRRERALADTITALADIAPVQAESTALTQADYQSIQEKTLISGSVETVTSAEGFAVQARTLSDYAAWRLTVDHVLLDNPGLRWQIVSLCSGKCPSGEAHRALLSAKRINVTNN